MDFPCSRDASLYSTVLYLTPRSCSGISNHARIEGDRSSTVLYCTVRAVGPDTSLDAVFLAEIPWGLDMGLKGEVKDSGHMDSTAGDHILSPAAGLLLNCVVAWRERPEAVRSTGSVPVSPTRAPDACGQGGT